MDVAKMRCALAELYGPTWRLKCQTMPDRQVVAIYKNMERTGRLKKKKPKKEPDIRTALQITIYDVLNERGSL